MEGVYADVASRFLRSLVRVLLVFAGLCVVPVVSASCLFSGNMTFSGGSGSTVWFDQAGRVLVGGRVWMESPNYSVGTYMSIVEGFVVAQRCDGFSRDVNNYVDMVYVPPANSTAIPNGWRIPTDNSSVVLDIQFPTGVPYPGGTNLGRSREPVDRTGSISGAESRPVFNVQARLSLVKTGAFTATKKNEAAGVLNKRINMGAFRYARIDRFEFLTSQDPAAMQATLFNSDQRGYVGAPSCVIAQTLMGEDNIGVAGINVITLPPISADRFRGKGAADQGARVREVVLHCWGLPSTTAGIEFDTRFQLSGVDGVGMPRANSDVGIQVLLGEKPVQFRVRSPIVLSMNKAVSKDFAYGGAPNIQGYYCVANCTADMSSNDWVNGQAVEDDVIRVPITFKYFQTTNARPAPKDFSVPFTVTVDVL